jgi:hypothetical protein
MAAVVATDFVPKDKRKDVDTAITCWSYMFMTILLALSKDDDEKLDEALIELAVPFEALRFLLCQDAEGGGRKKTVGGVNAELQLALMNAVGQERPRILARIQGADERMVEARKRALERFERKAPLVQLLLRISGAFLLVLLPIGNKLIDAGIAIKMAQLEASAKLAATTATGSMVSQIAIDGAIRGLDKIDSAFADVGAAGVQGATVASAAMKGIYGDLRNKITTFRSAPRLRETAAAQQNETLARWAITDKAVSAAQEYDSIFNESRYISKQLTISSGTVPSGPTEADSTPKAVKKIEDPINYVMGIKNLAMSGEAWLYLGLNTFEDHTMTFMKWSNTLAIILVGLISKDPGAVALCILWVLSSFVGVMWFLDCMSAVKNKAELDAAIALLNESEQAHELRRAEAELVRHDRDFDRLAVALARPPAQGGRRRTRRNRRHRLSAPTRKGRRTSYGGRTRYTRPRRG